MVSISYEEIEKNRIENIKSEVLELRQLDLADYISHKSKFFKISRFTLGNYLRRLEECKDIIIDRKSKTIKIFSEAETALEINPEDVCKICSQEILSEITRYVFDSKNKINLHKSCFQTAGTDELRELYKSSS